ncbi:DUF4258 domain-containing protein [bacterium]|nr:DUF4258 domain-containing protein [bacterium]
MKRTTWRKDGSASRLHGESHRGSRSLSWRRLVLTKHARSRARQRGGITDKQIKGVLQNGRFVGPGKSKGTRKYENAYLHGKIVVVVKKLPREWRVITVYWQ